MLAKINENLEIFVDADKAKAINQKLTAFKDDAWLLNNLNDTLNGILVNDNNSAAHLTSLIKTVESVIMLDYSTFNPVKLSTFYRMGAEKNDFDSYNYTKALGSFASLTNSKSKELYVVKVTNNDTMNTVIANVQLLPLIDSPIIVTDIPSFIKVTKEAVEFSSLMKGNFDFNASLLSGHGNTLINYNDEIDFKLNAMTSISIELVNVSERQTITVSAFDDDNINAIISIQLISKKINLVELLPNEEVTIENDNNYFVKVSNHTTKDNKNTVLTISLSNISRFDNHVFRMEADYKDEYIFIPSYVSYITGEVRDLDITYDTYSFNGKDTIISSLFMLPSTENKTVATVQNETVTEFCLLIFVHFLPCTGRTFKEHSKTNLRRR